MMEEAESSIALFLNDLDHESITVGLILVYNMNMNGVMDLLYIITETGARIKFQHSKQVRTNNTIVSVLNGFRGNTLKSTQSWL